MADRDTCDNPDRDMPRLVCGHPLPCPYHTVTIHLRKKPPTIEIPVTARIALRGRKLLADVAEILREQP